MTKFEELMQEREKRRTGNTFSSENSSNTTDSFGALMAERSQKKMQNVLSLYNNEKRKYLNDYNSRYYDSSGNKKEAGYRSDSADWLKSSRVTRNSLNSKKHEIEDILSENGNYYDSNYIKQVLDGLSSDSKLFDNIVSDADSENKYFSQWENEDAFNYAKAQNDKKQLYASMTDEELEKEIEKNKEGNRWYDKVINKVAEIGSYIPTTDANTPISTITKQQQAQATVRGAVEQNKTDSLEKDTNIAMLQQEKNNRVLKEYETLPDDVKNLLKGYVNADRKTDEANIGNIGTSLANALTGQQGGSNAYNTQNATAKSEAEEYAQLLNAKGIEWTKYVEPLRIATDEGYYANSRKENQEFAKEHPFLASAVSVLESPVKALGTIEMLESAVDDSSNQLNYNSPYFMGNRLVNDTREQVMTDNNWVIDANSDNPLKRKDWFDMFYGMAMSSGDSLVGMAMSGPVNASKVVKAVTSSIANEAMGETSGGAGILGLQAATDTAIETAENGGSKWDALVTGTIAGVNEALFEKISIGNFKSMAARSIGNYFSKEGVKTLFANLAKSAGVNATEEMCTEAANIVTDYLINGGTSSFVENYNAGLAQGLSEAEAKKQAYTAMVTQIGEAGVSGALQGLLFGGVGSATAAGSQRAEESALGKSYSGEDFLKLQQEAKELGIDVTKYENNSKAGRLETLVAAKKGEKAKADLINRAEEIGLDTKKYNTKTVEGFEKLTKAFKERNEAITNELVDTQYFIVKTAIKERLLDLNENITKARDYSTFLAKMYIKGESMPGNVIEELAYNDNVAKVQEELKNGAEWVDAVDTKVSRALDEIEKRYQTKRDKTREAEVDEKIEALSSPEGEVSETAEDFTEPETTNEIAEDPTESEVKRKIKNELRNSAVIESAGDMYDTLFDEYYNAGLKGIGSFEAFDKIASWTHQFAPESFRRSVYESAKNTRFNDPGVHRMYQQELDSRQQAQVDILDILGKKFDISFIVSDTFDGEGGNLNGFYLAGTNKVGIALDAEGDLYLRTAGHECYHYIEKWNKEGAEYLRDIVIDFLKRSKDYSYKEQVEHYAKAYKLNVVEKIDAIHSEMVADCMFDVFSNERFVNSLVKENKTLAQKVCDFIKELLSEIKNMIKNYHNSPEMEALKDMRALLDDINNIFVDELELASKNAQKAKNAELQSTAENSEQKNSTTEDGGVKYSFAGVKSETHDFSLLEQAIRLDDVGKATSEEIRQQTGWYRGYDNKWRYEIDDSKMEIDTRGKFSSNPDIRKYTELVDKAYFEMSASDSELQELRTLEKKLEGVSVEPKTLGELIKHDELFKAYPKLKSLPVYFEKNMVDALGYYGFDEIILDSRLKLHKEQLRRTLIHEIQHAIQHIEGFANGASPGYWESNKHRYTANENEQAQALKWDIYNLERTIKKEYGAEIFKNIVKYYELQNAYFDDSADTPTIEKAIKHIEIAAEDNGYAKVLDEYYDLKSNLELINLKVEKRSKMSNQELYLKTAGEIESRDVSSRLDLNESQRKELRPDINRTDVVFADDLTVGYSIVEPFTDNNGKYYENAVLLDTDIFDGVTPSKWWKVLKEYIEKRITKSTFIMPVTDENGEMQMLEFAKLKERVAKNNRKSSRVINELYFTSDNISKLGVIHIDEIIEVSEEKIPYHTKSSGHDWLDEGGWLHRKAHVINSKNGNIYQLTVDIAKTADGRCILYTTKGKIKRVGNAKVNSLTKKQVARKLNSNSKDSISNSSQNVNENQQNNAEIKKSLKLSPDAKKVLEENQELKQVFEFLQTQFKLARKTVPSEDQLMRYAEEFKKNIPTTLDVYKLKTEFRNIYSILTSMTDSRGLEYVTSATFKLAEKILKNSKVLDKINQDKKLLREQLNNALKNRKFKLTPEMQDSINEYYGSWNDLFKNGHGIVRHLNKEASVTLEDEWNDLCAELPDLLDVNTHRDDQLFALIEAFDITDVEYGYNDENVFSVEAQSLATEILSSIEKIFFDTIGENSLEDRHALEMNELREKTAKQIKKLKKKHQDDLINKSDYWREQIKKRAEQKRMTEMRNRIERQIIRLSGMLAKGTKNRHIPVQLISSVKELCEMFFIRDSLQKKLSENISKIEKNYNKLSQSDEFTFYNSFAPEVAELITQLKDTVGNKTVNSMTADELEQVDEVVRAIAQKVTRSNRLFIEGRQENASESAVRVMEELTHRKKEYALQNEKLNDFLNTATETGERFGWKLLKPVYAFRLIGSDTLIELEKNLRKGEDVWAVDLSEAQKKFTELTTQYNHNKWKNDKVVVHLFQGDVSFSIQQLMSLYCAFQRKQFVPHLLNGGFAFDKEYVSERAPELDAQGNRKRDKNGKELKYKRYVRGGTVRLHEDDFKAISDALSSEQRAYADSMRDYLSIDLAEKGNFVTRQLYDTNRFIEDKYFPIKAAREFVRADYKDVGEKSILGMGMTKDLQEMADNPVLLRDFDTVWAEHVQQMATYHAFALRIDDFNKVFNYGTKNTADKVGSVKSKLQEAWGPEAVNYIETFLKDVNGRLRVDDGGSFLTRGISQFKKASVLASASVVIQQPSAMVRAMAEVDGKYFLQKPSFKEYEEMQRYAPIAQIKAMGFFDTGIGPSTINWLLEPTYEKDEIIKGLLQDEDYRKKVYDKVVTFGPEIMDELTWVQIWKAVKKEQQSLNKNLQGEELLKKTAERFTEVIELTQVYDSVFSKSEIMRSKDTGAKMVTAFMAEPTVSLNMYVDAVLQGKRVSKKKAARIIFSVIGSAVFNALLKSIISAARDDDEKKTQLEKYVSAVITNSISDILPWNMVPVLRDVSSIFNGYDVERSDMSVIADLAQVIESLTSDEKSTGTKFIDLAGAVSAFFGFPLKNVVRDIRAVINTHNRIWNTKDAFDFEWAAIGIGLEREAYSNILFRTINGGEKKNSDYMYEAIKKQDMKRYNYLVEELGSPDKVHSAMVRGLKDNDSRVLEAAQYRLKGDSVSFGATVKEIVSDGFPEKQVISAVNSMYNQLTEETEEESPEKEKSIYNAVDLYNAVNSGTNYAEIIDDMIEVEIANGKTEEQAENTVRGRINSSWKEEFINASEYEREEIRDKLDKTGLYEDVEETTNSWLLTILKDRYKEATSYSERKAIENQIWALDYYDSRASMKSALKKMMEDDSEEK